MFTPTQASLLPGIQRCLLYASVAAADSLPWCTPTVDGKNRVWRERVAAAEEGSISIDDGSMTRMMLLPVFSTIFVYKSMNSLVAFAVAQTHMCIHTHATASVPRKTVSVCFGSVADAVHALVYILVCICAMGAIHKQESK